VDPICGGVVFPQNLPRAFETNPRGETLLGWKDCLTEGRFVRLACLEKFATLEEQKPDDLEMGKTTGGVRGPKFWVRETIFLTVGLLITVPTARPQQSI
jgi:hypothetical protein